jgi:two-component system, NarL family, response regulator LiaR
MNVRLVLVADHLVLRQGLRALLGLQSGIEIVGEADYGTDAVDVVRVTRPDIVLVDLNMPEMDGVTATRLIHDTCPDTRVLILSGTEDEGALVAAVRAGATGFVSKCVPIDVLVTSVRAAARGEAQFSPALAMVLMDELREPTVTEHLTRRELEILELVTDGLANKEIAWKLRISEKTVKSHVSRILNKFGVQSRTQVAVRAARSGLVRPERMRARSLQVGGGAIVPLRRATAERQRTDAKLTVRPSCSCGRAPAA